MKRFTDISEEERIVIQNGIFADMEQANSDTWHPGWHFTPPSHFMLDVWGAIKHDGVYHIFYGVCRESGDMAQDTVFGHAVSRDLVKFRHMPLPICPAWEELRMNDGCVCIDKDGIPVMLYTSVPKDENTPRSHVAAIGDRKLVSFKRSPVPFMTLDNHGGPEFEWGWSDPFVFSAFGRTFMVMSKCVDKDGRNRMPIYESLDGSYTRWEYRGIMIEDNGEVVNFFPLGDKWVLIFCPYSTIKYFVGTFDEETLTFTPEKEGVLCYGYVKQETDRGFYATCIYPEADRTVICGWISGFDRQMWDGCMGTPRTVGINNDLCLVTMPINEILGLRREHTSFVGTKGEMFVSSQADIEIEFCGDIKLEFEDSVTVAVRNNGFSVDCLDYPDTLCEVSTHKLRILLDNSFIELYFDDGSTTAVRPVKYLSDKLRLKIEGDVRIDAWRMDSVETESEIFL